MGNEQRAGEVVCKRCNNSRKNGSEMAYINGTPYCHGIFDRDPTCYQREQRDRLEMIK